MWHLNQEQLNERIRKKAEEIIVYCDECDKKTPHISEEGHNGFDSWSHSYCLVCEKKDGEIKK